MPPVVRPSSAFALATFSLFAATALLAGCGISGSSAPATSGSEPLISVALKGVAHGGQQPIAGATVTVYAAGNTGYGSAATGIATTTTDANGNFAFGATQSDTIFCPATNSATESEVLYIVASGGDPLPSTPNTASVLMAALGDCRTLENAQPFVMLNEVSTFAGMTAMQHFFSDTTNYKTLGSIGVMAEGFGTTATNTAGLVNASAAASLLMAGTQTISAATGADPSVAGSTVTITPETAKLFLAANVLAACVNSSGSGSTSCSTLFSDVSATPATDTLQVAYSMATNPTDTVSGTSNIVAVYSMAGPTSPFQTAATSATDWTLGITYGTTSVGAAGAGYYLMTSPEYVAIDPEGDIWVANYNSATTGSSVTELSPGGAPLKQVLAGAFLKASALAIDPAGDVWVSNAGATSLVEYPAGAATTAANTFTTSIAPYALTIDGAGNVYDIGKSGTVIQKVPAGSASGTTPTTIATGLTTTYPALALDSHYNIWLATGTTVDQLLYSSSYGTVTSAGTTAGLAAPETITVDPTGNVWAGNYSTTAGSLSELYATSTTSITGPAAAYADATGLYDNKMVVSDSAGNIFTANSHTTSGGVVEFTNGGALISPAAGYAHTYYYSQSVALDASGNVWIGSEETPTSNVPFITEIVGIATPTMTPVASNLPTTPNVPNKATLAFSSLPNAFETQGAAWTYSPVSSSANTASATGTFSLMNGTTTLCSVTGTVAPGGTFTCNGAATTLAPGTYSVAAVYSGDATYAPSSTPVSFIVEPTAASVTTTASMTGSAVSGTLPIVGATVTLWATANNGIATPQTGGEVDAAYYKGGATVLGSATTNTGGNFTLGKFECTNPDQLYVTVSGGETSGTISNPNILLLAALGQCSTASALTPVVNEVTTVAAAYTLAPFISITNTDVNITASATNYATATQTTGTMYHPVGLQHAFLNAANLASVTTGAANSTLSGYSTTTVPIMPNPLIDSVANVLAACTQTSTNCPAILGAALPLTTGTATAPTTTLAAALNIARNPFMGGAGAAATWLGLAAGGSAPYTPALPVSGAGTTAALPHDLSAAIIYPKGLTTSASVALQNVYGQVSTLDANDEYYLVSEATAASPYYYDINGFASNGQNVMHHLYCQTSLTYNQATCPEALQAYIEHIAADQLGNIWLLQYGTASPGANFSATNTQATMIQISAATGAFENIPANTATQISTYDAPAYAYDLAIDQNNDVWVGTETTAGYIYNYVNTSPTPSTSVTIATTTLGTAEGQATNLSYGIAFDAQQNLFSTLYSTTANTNGVAVVPNSGLTSTTYPATSNGAIPTTFTPVGANTPHVATQGSYGYSLAFDSLGNIYESAGSSTTAGATGDGINVVTRPPTDYTNNVLTNLTTNNTLLTGSAISTSNGLVNVSLSRPNQITEDGAGAIYIPDYAANTVVRLYGPTGSSIMAYYPCVATTCSTVYASGTNLFAVKQVFVDSTGTVDAMTTTNGNWVQIFGIGTPSFPLLQAGHPAQMP